MYISPKHIIITKPITTATVLLHRLHALGLPALLFPTIEIVGNPEASTYFQNFINTPFNIALFISPTAVHYGANLCALNPSMWSETRFIAQGPGTANALIQTGFFNIITPEKEYSSETLLALPILKQVKKQKIALFKGKGGRNALTPYLQQQGAEIITFDCYERRCPAPTLALENYIADPKQSLFIVTSNTGLQNLARLLHFEQLMHNPDWRDCHLLLTHDKMRVLAHQLGHKGKITVAKDASNEAIELVLRTLFYDGYK